MNDDKNLNNKENLKAENDFLKMKIMLEHGGDFYSSEHTKEPLEPNIENQFLNHIIEFEKQFQQRTRINVYDKIGKPQQFKSVQTISDDAIDVQWSKLSEYMQQHGVELSVCSPRVTTKELYRFTTEELFYHEADDINIPGMMTNFIYDEFYPDHEYDNTRHAIDDCINLILCKKPVEWFPFLASENLQLNNHTHLDEEKFKALINIFKSTFDDIELKEIEALTCNLQKETCKVSGSHQTTLIFDGIPINVNGNWVVEFVLQYDYWVVANVQIENIRFD